MREVLEEDGSSDSIPPLTFWHDDMIKALRIVQTHNLIYCNVAQTLGRHHVDVLWLLSRRQTGLAHPPKKDSTGKFLLNRAYAFMIL